MQIFTPADLLIPKTENLEKWSVIACDQYTSQPEYWEEIRQNVGACDSTLKMILPEAWMENVPETEKRNRIRQICKTMKEYQEKELFEEYKNAFVYVERTLLDGRVRKGIVGAIDLEAYDYLPEASSAVRASEQTVTERIPFRKALRKSAALELSHVLVFSNDEQDLLGRYLESCRLKLPLVYSFDLLPDGGHIEGRLVNGEYAEKLRKKLEQYQEAMEHNYQDPDRPPVLFAVADGNHSLAAAKACYEELKKEVPSKDLSAHPARFAMVEIINIHDEAQQFEAIHRIVKNTDTEKILQELKNTFSENEGERISWYTSKSRGVLYVNPQEGRTAAEVLQEFLDEYLSAHTGMVDYIHGAEILRKLAQNDQCIGFLLPKIRKENFFEMLTKNGVFPRKTFSVGRAGEKRYYLECRKI